MRFRMVVLFGMLLFSMCPEAKELPAGNSEWSSPTPEKLKARLGREADKDISPAEKKILLRALDARPAAKPDAVC